MSDVIQEDLVLGTEEQTYWAAEEDQHVFVDNCRERIVEFFDALRHNRLLRRIMRSWRYYHGLFFTGSYSDTDTEIKHLGDSGEYAGLSVNDFRSLIDQAVAMVTRQAPQFNPVAKNTDQRSLQQAKEARGLLEEWFDSHHVDMLRENAVRHAFVCDVGYMRTVWNKNAKPLAGDPRTGALQYQGDVKYTNPIFLDVVYDATARDQTEWQWIFVRERVNKYDLAVRYPDRAEDILLIDPDTRDDEDLVSFKACDYGKSDLIDVWCFEHLPSDALPQGRYAEFTADILLEDGPNPYKELTVDRVTAGELLLTCFGYSPALDMQGPQEATNAEYSTIATNHKAHGVPRTWVQEGDAVSHTVFSDGLTILQSNTKPEKLDLVGDMREQERFAGMMQVAMERISGINSVRRGMPEGGLKGASGAAFALLDAKAVEANSSIIKSDTRCMEAVATKTLRYLNTYSNPEHPIQAAIRGKFGRSYAKDIVPGYFDLIDRVSVKVGAALLATQSGRWEIAQALLGQKRVTVEEFITFIETGKIEPMIEAATMQLGLIREENERFLARDFNAPVLAIDDHALHVREHATVLGTPEARNDPVLAAGTLAHIMSHMQALQAVDTQMLQLVLGYDLPLPAQPGMPMQGSGMQGDTNDVNEVTNAVAGEPAMPEESSVGGQAE